MSRPTLLTEEAVTTIVDAIRGGSFDWVAAEAAGIHRRTFYKWLKRGEEGEQPYAELVRAVRRARAQARISAERAVRERDPLAWLRLGPGREREDEPGWTTPSKPLAGLFESAEDERSVLRVIEAMVKAAKEDGGRRTVGQDDRMDRMRGGG